MISKKNWARERQVARKPKPGPRRTLSEKLADLKARMEKFSAELPERLRAAPGLAKERARDGWAQFKLDFMPVYVKGYGKRYLQLTGRITVWLLLISYVSVGGQLSWRWVTTVWARHVPLSEVKAYADTYLVPNKGSSDPEGFRVWLDRRDYREADQLIRVLEPDTPRMSGLTFIIYSNWVLQLKRPDDALFWREFALYRTRYDTMRCGTALGTQHMSNLLSVVLPTELDDYLRSDLKLLPQAMRRVLEYDRKWPALDDPTQFCRTIININFEEIGKRNLVPRDQWVPEYMTLRYTSEVELHELEKKAGIAPPAPGKTSPPPAPGAATPDTAPPAPAEKNRKKGRHHVPSPLMMPGPDR